MKTFSKSRQEIIELENGKKIRTSKAEKDRMFFLRNQEKIGNIKNLQMQVPYELLIPVKYVADFVYEIDGKKIVEDVKGRVARTYVRNRKYMKKIHNIHIHEVTKYDEPCSTEQKKFLQSDEAKKIAKKKSI